MSILMILGEKLIQVVHIEIPHDTWYFSWNAGSQLKTGVYQLLSVQD